MAENEQRQHGKAREKAIPEFEDRVVAINRVAKVIKGGKRVRFAVLIVLGDKKGRVGFGMGKAAEVPDAIAKATAAAKKNMITVSLKDTTIPHEALGVYGAGRVVLKPAAQGTGVIAGGPVRQILEVAGIKNIRTKSLGTNNPINCVKATFNGLCSLRTAEQIAALRGKTVEEIKA